MEPNETILVSGKIIAEFEDDASGFLSGIPEFVNTSETTVAPIAAAAPTVNDTPLGKPG